MKTYFKFYFDTYLDGRDETPAFIIITDGDKYGIAFPDGVDEETSDSMCAVIGARIEASTRYGKPSNPNDVLNFIPYNMMFLSASETEDVYPSWEEATNCAKQSLSAFSDGMTEWKFKLQEPIFPDFSDNDNKSEEE